MSAALALGPPLKAERDRVQKGYYMLKYTTDDKETAKADTGRLYSSSSSKTTTIAATTSARIAATKGRRQLLTLKTFKVLSERTKLCIQKALLQLIIIYRHNHTYKRKFNHFHKWYMNVYRVKHDESIAAVLTAKDSDIKLLRDAAAKRENDYKIYSSNLIQEHIDEIESLDKTNNETISTLHRNYNEKLRQLSESGQRERTELQQESTAALNNKVLYYESALANLSRIHDADITAARSEIDKLRSYYDTSIRDLSTGHDRERCIQEELNNKIVSNLNAKLESALAASNDAHRLEIDSLVAKCDRQHVTAKTDHEMAIRRLREKADGALLEAYRPKLAFLGRLHSRLKSTLLKRRAVWTLWINTIARYDLYQSLLCNHRQHLQYLAKKFYYIHKRESRIDKLTYYFNAYRRNVFYLRASGDLRDLTERLMRLERLEECVESDVTAEMKRLNPRFDLKYLPLLLHYKYKSYMNESVSHSFINKQRTVNGGGGGGDINYHLTIELRKVAYENLRLFNTMGMLIKRLPFDPTSSPGDPTSSPGDPTSSPGVEVGYSELSTETSAPSPHAYTANYSSPARSPARGPVRSPPRTPKQVEVESIRLLLEQHQRSYGYVAGAKDYL